jgi:hypothetical protein
MSLQGTRNVIDALATITQRDPVEVIERVRTIFSQQGWVVQGNVYQAAGNIIIQQGSEKKEKQGIDLWVKIVGLIATILTIIISGITIYKNFGAKEGKPTTVVNQPTPKMPLRGVVRTYSGETVSEATVSIYDETGRSVTTTSDGGFYFANISGVSGDRVRIYVKKPGYRCPCQTVS